MKAIRTISAVLFSLLVLVSSTSFMVGFHICMGEVENIALFNKAEGCEKEKSLPPCHKHMKPACCEDETFIHEGDDFKASVQHIHIVAAPPIDLEHPPVLIAEVIPTAEIAKTQYFDYDPPLRTSDLTVSLHVFLI
jgi:hypothetical protein